LAAAENIALNAGYDDPAQQTVDSWLKSPGHRRNLFDSRWQETGIRRSVSKTEHFVLHRFSFRNVKNEAVRIYKEQNVNSPFIFRNWRSGLSFPGRTRRTGIENEDIQVTEEITCLNIEFRKKRRGLRLELIYSAVVFFSLLIGKCSVCKPV